RRRCQLVATRGISYKVWALIPGYEIKLFTFQTFARVRFWPSQVTVKVRNRYIAVIVMGMN
ncbi:MAG: hypothetical protein ACYTBW_05985, partial [Planctomycetota bacterium]